MATLETVQCPRSTGEAGVSRTDLSDHLQHCTVRDSMDTCQATLGHCIPAAMSFRNILSHCAGVAVLSPCCRTRINVVKRIYGTHSISPNSGAIWAFVVRQV